MCIVYLELWHIYKYLKTFFTDLKLKLVQFNVIYSLVGIFF